MKYRMHTSSLSKAMVDFNLDLITADYTTRLKHLKLLETHYPAGVPVLKRYLIARRKHFVKLAYTKQKNKAPVLLQHLIATQKAQGNHLGVLKSRLGFWSYRIFGKGYWFFR